MPRYIDADELIKKIFPIGLVDDGKYTINAKAVKHAIDQTPTADVVEVVRCTNCGHIFRGVTPDYFEIVDIHCLHCGTVNSMKGKR